MSSGKLLAIAAMVAAPATMADAQTARTSPDQVICAMSGVCGTDAAPAADQQIRVGQEKSFSLVRPTAAQATPQAQPPIQPRPAAQRAKRRMAAAPIVRRAPAPRPASGRLDMLVNFPLGSSDLSGASRQELQSFATAMASPTLAGMRFNVEGHTDAVGGRDYNLELSRKRANAVVTYLTSLGVDPSRLHAEGFGFDKPRPGLSAKAAGNRRVEFVKSS